MPHHIERVFSKIFQIEDGHCNAVPIKLKNNSVETTVSLQKHLLIISHGRWYLGIMVVGHNSINGCWA